MSIALGFSYGHNASACLVRDGDLLVAVQEERLTGRKRQRLSPGDPARCVDYCLDAVGITGTEVDIVALVGASVLHPPLGAALQSVPVTVVGHHEAHAAGAYLTSGAEHAAVLVIDAAGDPLDGDPDHYESVTAYRAAGGRLEMLWKLGGRSFEQLHPGPGLPRFRSIGGMYSAVAYAIFGSIGDSGKVMGLAPSGTARWSPDAFFAWSGDDFVFRDGLPDEVARWRPWPDDGQRWADLAASTQGALEHALALLLARLRSEVDGDLLCLSGGVALNGVANEGPVARAGWPRIWIPPWAEDSGLAVGAALLAARRADPDAPPQRRLRRDSLGRQAHADTLAEATALASSFADLTSGADLHALASRLAGGTVVGWFDGGSELGPRALGHRSILADPRDPDARQRLNDEVKHREGFRPFAPAVLVEAAAEWFALPEGDSSPFMLRVVEVHPSRTGMIPAVVHVDGTARAQTVDAEDEPRFAELLSAFEAVTGVPVLLNTSFNVMGEPIVESPIDAVWSFATTGIDVLWLEGAMLTKRRGVDPLSMLRLRATPGWHHAGNCPASRWSALLGERGPLEILRHPSQVTPVLAPVGTAALLQLAVDPVAPTDLLHAMERRRADVADLSVLRRLGVLHLTAA